MRTESDVLRIDSTDMQKVTNQFKLMGYIKETRFTFFYTTSVTKRNIFTFYFCCQE